MSEVSDLGAYRLARRESLRRKKLDREAYADALREQRARPKEEWEVELEAIIGPAGDGA